MNREQIFHQINGTRRWLASLPERLPSACPLCRLAARGGHLCEGCEADFFTARQHRALCTRCASDLVEDSSCVACQANDHWPLQAVGSALDYELGGQMLIRRYKEGGQLALARLLARLMVAAATPVLRNHRPVAWVPVPASEQRLNRTGFSPAQQLASLVARQTGVPCRLDWLTQFEPVAAQKTLSRTARQAAVQGRFVAMDVPVGCTVGLVDDVMTTGSTLQAAAVALKAAGANRVIAVVAAKTPTVW